MINATEDIMVFNAHLGDDRRESYIATRICAVCVYESNAVLGDDGKAAQHDKFTIRIPVGAKIEGGKTYTEPERFKRLPLEEAKKHWTIQIGDCIADMAMYAPETWEWNDFSFRDGVITADVLNQSGGIANLIEKKYGKLISVTSFADNTKRGSDRTKHWRIGGE